MYSLHLSLWSSSSADGRPFHYGPNDRATNPPPPQKQRNNNHQRQHKVKETSLWLEIFRAEHVDYNDDDEELWTFNAIGFIREIHISHSIHPSIGIAHVWGDGDNNQEGVKDRPFTTATNQLGVVISPQNQSKWMGCSTRAPQSDHSLPCQLGEQHSSYSCPILAV